MPLRCGAVRYIAGEGEKEKEEGRRETEEEFSYPRSSEVLLGFLLPGAAFGPRGHEKRIRVEK